MIPLTVSLLVGSLVAFLGYKLINLRGYVRSAKGTGLPYVVVPALETEIVSQLATPLLRYLYTNTLDNSRGWPRWCRFMIKDWSWEDKRLAHDELGDVFLCVSPEGIICYTADAAMGWDVMNRRNEFTKPRDKYKLLEPYGPNVATAEGSTYRFHVRITAPPFSDISGVNELVWQETSDQTRGLMQRWSKVAPEDLHEDVNALTLAVIALAGFGQKIDSGKSQNDVPKGYKISFLRAISDTTAYMVAILVFPGWFLDLTPLANANLARTQLDKYLREIILRERSDLESGREVLNGYAKANLLTAVMKASYDEATQSDTKRDSKVKHAFSDDEVMGNLFIYLLAGYETTANAISYGLIALALYSDIQDNVISELDRVYTEAIAEGRNTLSYKQDFSKLQYMYGFMYETFRLFPGVTLITKMCHEQQLVRVAEKENKQYMLPSQCRVYLSAPGVHYNPKYWPDPYELQPERWIDFDSSKGGTASVNGQDMKKTLAADKTRQMRGTLLTFSDGSRACLGRKFAQAEYMAFLATLLRSFKIVLAPGQNLGQVKSDLFKKCAGKVTLAPLGHVRLQLERRHT